MIPIFIFKMLSLRSIRAGSSPMGTSYIPEFSEVIIAFELRVKFSFEASMV
jgi:hypothetical protein